MSKLSKRVVDAQKARDKDFIAWDDGLPGFGLRVFSSGRRSYLVQYRAKGRTRRLTIGAHGIFTVEEARNEARRLLLDAKMGKDPSQARHDEAGGPTVNDLADRYMKDHAIPHKKSAEGDRWILDTYIRPRFGCRKVSDVTHAEIDRMHGSMSDKPIMANRVHALLSTMFGFAERWGMREPGTSPSRGVKRFKERRRERFLSAAELSRLGEVLREEELQNPKRAAAVAAIRVLVLTGARRGEIENLQWSDVDLMGAVLHLRDSKTGPKKLILNAPAVEVFAGLERCCDWPFPNRKGTGPIDLSSSWIRVRRLAGLEGVRLHDLRHSHASVGVNAGLGLPILSKLLGHSSTAMTERYSHLSDDPMREASELIGSRIAASLDGREKAEVVPLDRRDG